MKKQSQTEYVQTLIIGGGQSGLSVGYHLARRGLPFIILDSSARIGDAWRNRWDSLRLFTPARFDGLAGMPFPAPANSFPTKNQMADYLEDYASRFHLPVRAGVRVDGLSKEGCRYIVTAGEQRFEADHVVVAMSGYQTPRVPRFAPELDSDIVQFHSSGYRSPKQLKEGAVLIVGAGNSGSEIALEVARSRRTWLAGRDTGHIPFRCRWPCGKVVLSALCAAVRLSPGAYYQDAHGSKDAAQGAFPRRPADSGQTRGPCRGRHSARSQARWRAGRVAAT